MTGGEAGAPDCRGAASGATDVFEHVPARERRAAPAAWDVRYQSLRQGETITVEDGWEPFMSGADPAGYTSSAIYLRRPVSAAELAARQAARRAGR